MSIIEAMITELSEVNVAEQATNMHDDARAAYHRPSNTVRDFDEFTAVTADYLNYHLAATSMHGGRLSDWEARSRAKNLIEREYRRHNSDIVGAYNDARTGTNSGLRHVLDIICEGLKYQAMEDHFTDVFDRYVTPCSWSEKVDIIRQLIQHGSFVLPPDFDKSTPERYASNYRPLIQGLVSGVRGFHNQIRRM